MDFIGLQMMVTLRNPSGVQLKGTVSEVTPGASLVLSNGRICSFLFCFLPMGH
jgi:enhancer of mRNA-decapping protein 3